MCGQDNYATGAEVHADWWEGLCTTALKLDLFDFTESGYALPRHNTHGLRSGPSPSKRKLRSSQESPAKKKRGPPLKEIEEESSEDDDENYVEFGDDEGLDNIATPTSRLGADILGSSGSSMLPPLSVTPKTPPMVGHPQKKRESLENIVVKMAEMQDKYAETLANLQRQQELAQKQNEVALAQIKADAAKERQENLELHRSTQSWMERESQTNREFMLNLLNIRNAQPMAAIAPDGSSPKLQLEGVPSDSNNSGASTHQMMAPAPPPLPTEEPVQVPLLPSDECVHSLSPVGGLAVEECRGRSQEEAGCSSVPCNEVVVGHNLIGVSSEDKIGSNSLQTGDLPAGCAQ